MNPLVSVITPCYNAAHTLLVALASLIAQTYDNWECIVVDDGSTDHSRVIIETIHDSRIRYIRLEQNMGRGFARQTALEHATGAYLAMLDADDWLYPGKLQRQVEVLEAEKQLTLVSSGMAIIDEYHNIVAVRGCGSQGKRPVFSGPLPLGMPPIVFPPCMIRMPCARQVKYDLSFRVAEDADFLLRLLLDKYYCILPDVLYAYNEYASVTLTKMLLSYQSNLKTFHKYTQRFPVASRMNIVKIFMKSLFYRLFFAMGVGNILVKRRSRHPTKIEKEAFEFARQTVFHLSEQQFHGLFSGHLRSKQ